MAPIRIVNVPDVSSSEAFVDLPGIDGRPLEWIGHSGLPENALERAVRRPRLSRYRAAWQATRDARNADFVISHLPRMTAAVEHFARWRGNRRPHLAFSFNFTDLPEGNDLRRMQTAFADVERFCVYSRYEASIYPDLFNLPGNRFQPVMWGQQAPIVDTSAEIPDRPFVVAIGGEGRDYAGIIEAARARPDISWIVIARPNSLFDTAPSNVAVRFNLPAPLTWGIAARAAAVVVALRDETTCCGHITIASTQLLGLPLITTRSYATEEYVAGIPNTVVVEPSDPDMLGSAASEAIARSNADPGQSDAVRALAQERYDRTSWAKYIANFARDYV